MTSPQLFKQTALMWTCNPFTQLGFPKRKCFFIVSCLRVEMKSISNQVFSIHAGRRPLGIFLLDLLCLKPILVVLLEGNFVESKDEFDFCNIEEMKVNAILTRPVIVWQRFCDPSPDLGSRLSVHVCVSVCVSVLTGIGLYIKCMFTINHPSCTSEAGKKA